MVNRAALLVKNREIQMGTIEMPVCNENEVIVKIQYCGVCGSDVHFYQDGDPDFPDVYPYILGHECAGEVVETGSLVTNLKAGDRVCLEPGISCGHCEWCKSGKYNLCPNVKFLSAPRYNGAMRDYLAHPAELCFKLPDQVSTRDGALIEPLAVGMNAVLKSGVHGGKKVVVFGAGCIGLVTVLALKSVGVQDITVIDVIDKRLEKALELGAARVINGAKEDMIQRVDEICGGKGADFIFDMAGSQQTASATIQMAKIGGTIIITGIAYGSTPMNLRALVDKELKIEGSFRYRNVYPAAIEAVASGLIDISKIASHCFDFEQTMDAFEACINDKETLIKAVLKM